MFGFALVLDDEIDLLAGPYFDPVGRECHFTVGVARCDGKCARGLFGIARLAGIEGLMAVIVTVRIMAMHIMGEGAAEGERG
jgi:hypothetical protein